MKKKNLILIGCLLSLLLITFIGTMVGEWVHLVICDGETQTTKKVNVKLTPSECKIKDLDYDKTPQYHSTIITHRKLGVFPFINQTETKYYHGIFIKQN